MPFMPAALYIHIPWCIKKCPYCDFNSHKAPAADLLPENLYVDALIEDLKQDLELLPKRAISSVFIGGGTPSLLSPNAYALLFEKIQAHLSFQADIEITLEANPGTVDEARFKGYRDIGINRLSLGIQSFDPTHLKRLGRIHGAPEAHSAIVAARRAGFDNINLDLMHGLPSQTLEEGLADLSQALHYAPEHLSWYQLTLEPNTVFYKENPPLPSENVLEGLETQGLELLRASGFERYEISAFVRNGRALYSRHNLNYWLYGDYYGIGAGAHGKITDDAGKIVRTQKQRQPKDYLDLSKPFRVSTESPDEEQVLFEFMLNTTRLQESVPFALFEERTGFSFDVLEKKLWEAEAKGLVSMQADSWQVTELGRRFTNDLQGLFLP